MDRIRESSGLGVTNGGTTMSTDSAGSINKFVNPGILLFMDQLLMAIGGWIYWLMVSKFVTTSEVGNATTVYSLVLLINTIAQLGFEYPLLKKSMEHKQRVFGTVMLLELIITATSIPVVIVATSYLYQESAELVWIAIGILVLTSVGFVSRFALLGISQAKTVLILDLVGTVLKFGAAFALISIGYGAIGILVSFLIQAIVIGFSATLVARKQFGFGVGNSLFRKEVIKEGLVNLPSKLSGLLIISLSVILLAYFGVASSQIGIFYITMMMSVVAGSFASSLAFMSLPASSETKIDLSTGSLRMGLALTAPIITILLLAPDTILSLVGTEYTSASGTLPILGAAVLPSVILSNASTKFNNLNAPKKLLAIGAMRIGIFLAAFFVLVPIYGSMGAAYAILLSFACSASLSLAFSGKATSKYIAITILAIGAALFGGQILRDNLPQSMDLIIIISSVGICLAIVLALKCISIGDLSLMTKSLLKQRTKVS